MKREEILHLAELARIELSESEIERFTKEFGAILEYVDGIKAITEGADKELAVGALHNVFREDENPHEPDIYTEELLKLAPSRQGRYVRVKKILDTGS